MHCITGLHQSYCPVSLLKNIWCYMYWFKWGFKTCIFHLYIGSLQTRMEICGCFLRMTKWVFAIRKVELKFSAIVFWKKKILKVAEVGQGTALVCYSKILSVNLIEVRNFMWKYCSKMAVHVSTERHVTILESKLIFSSWWCLWYRWCKNCISYEKFFT